MLSFGSGGIIADVQFCSGRLIADSVLILGG